MVNQWIKKTILSIAVVGLFSFPVFAVPDEVITHIALPAWDYHETHYDSEGQERVKSDVTTFYIGPDLPINDSTVPNFTDMVSNYDEDVIIPFVSSTEEHERWANGICKVTTNCELSKSPHAETELTFRVQNDKIFIAKENNALKNNRRHMIKVYSKNGKTAQVIVDIQKPEPTLRVHGNYEAVTNQDILFELVNFNYGIVNPIYEVSLNGRVLKSEEEYHVVSNLVRLKNDGKIKTPGTYTLTVRAYGFKDANLTFIVRENVAGYVAPTGFVSDSLADEAFVFYDAIASASGGSGGSGGSIYKPAKLVFNYDSVLNAYALRTLGMQTEASERVIFYWESSAKEMARMKGSDTYYEWADYKAKVMAANVDGRGLSFEAYTDLPDAIKVLNRPYMVKHVLEDGLLGTPMYFSRIDDVSGPILTVQETKVGESFVISYTENPTWEQNFLGVFKHTHTQLSTSDFQVSDYTITIAAHHLAYGKNSFTFKAKGFDDIVLDFIVEKDNIVLDVEGSLILGEDVLITGLTPHYIQNLRGIKLNGKNLLSVNAGGSSGHYDFVDEKLVLFSKNFNDNAVNHLVFTSDRYEERSLEFALVGDKEVVSNPLKKIPVGLRKSYSVREGNPLEFTIATKMTSDDLAYLSQMQDAVLILNGVEAPYDLIESMFSVAMKIDANYLEGDDIIEAIFKVNTYEDYAFEIKVTRPKPEPVNPEPEQPEPEQPEPEQPEPADPEPELKKIIANFTQREESTIFFSDEVRVKYHFELKDKNGLTNEDSTYLSSNYKITLNDTSLSMMHFTLVKSNWNQPVTKIIIDSQYLKDIILDGENTLIIEQEGYETLTAIFIGAKES